ncbi:MAG: hypothetical protein R3C14_10815 [Caldilineaceae bacterium]
MMRESWVRHSPPVTLFSVMCIVLAMAFGVKLWQGLKGLRAQHWAALL